MADEHTSGVSHPASEAVHPPAKPISEEAVRAALKKVLESHEFRASRRCQDFLRFVVENTLAGRTEILKERTIGIEAFGRPPSYDPSGDATVRVKAGEVRKRLGLYYAGEGRADEVKIELPAGGYVPDFSWAPAFTLEKETGAAAIASARTSAGVRRRMAVAGLLLAVAAILGWAGLRHRPTVVDAFWSPLLAGSSPALICAAYVPVYTDGQQGPGEPRNLKDFVLLNDQFVGGGDLVAATQLSGMLSRMGRAYQVRIGNEVSFQDLKTSPAILIGYSYSRWKEISSELRFFIDISKHPAVITDNGAPTKWFLPNLGPDRRTDEDYALVSRVFHTDTRAMMVELSGITQYGTEAAAEMVTNPSLLGSALSDAPPGWQKKNLQLVLHVKVISGTPASTTVIARHFW